MRIIVYEADKCFVDASVLLHAAAAMTEASTTAASVEECVRQHALYLAEIAICKT